MIQKAVSMLCDESFLNRLTSLIAYLRRQQNLTREMKTVCPRYADTRWLSIGKVPKWLVENRIRVCLYLEEKNPPCKPDSVWWAALYGLRGFIGTADKVMAQLQGMSYLLSQQRAALERLVLDLGDLVRTTGPVEEHEVAELDLSSVSVSGRFAVQNEKAREYLED